MLRGGHHCAGLHYFFPVRCVPAAIDPNAAAVTQVWSYIGELVFNMLVLVGAVKMADRVCARDDGPVKKEENKCVIKPMCCT